MSTPVPVIVAGVRKSFGTTEVLHGVDLVAPAGKVTAVLGSSGSGKTTLLRVVVGFERPDAGSVTVGDMVVADEHTGVPVERRRVGYVSQEGSLFPHLDVRANVAFGLPRQERRGAAVDRLLGMVGIEELGTRYPHQLSGGQQQRVALARALATEPDVVLLDEPFSSLDANLRASVRDEVCGILRERGTTTILVTHDQDEALSTSDVVAVLRRGVVAQAASPADLYLRPVDPELATFVGQANFLEGAVEGGSAATPLGLVPMAGGGPTGAGLVTVLIRPEQLELAADGGGQLARVVGVEFHGHDSVVRLVADQADGRALTARLNGAVAPAVGSSVHIEVAGPVTAWRRDEEAVPAV
jgi:iron(III) transport system ATP-binding protein